jgi:hypothetical protein
LGPRVEGDRESVMTLSLSPREYFQRIVNFNTRRPIGE